MQDFAIERVVAGEHLTIVGDDEEPTSRTGYKLSPMLILVVLFFLLTVASLMTFIFSFLIAATSHGAPVAPSVFKTVRRSGILTLIGFLLTLVTLVIFGAMHQS